MGLIDVLTQYDARKKAAHAAKTVKHGVRPPCPPLPPPKKHMELMGAAGCLSKLPPPHETNGGRRVLSSLLGWEAEGGGLG